MSYIRTKDGVYEVKREELLCGVKFYDYETGDWLNRIRDEFIIKQSEDLEELCDEFIDEEQHYIIQNKEIIREIPNNQTLKNHTIYGAIWTDKGLIYVAKMNDKGELELI